MGVTERYRYRLNKRRKKIESRKNSVTKPAFEEDISDNDGNSQPGEADDEIDDMMSDLDCVRTTN